MLAALGVSLIHKWPLPAIAAGRAQPLESDALFFAGDSPASIYRLPASEPGQMAGRAAATAAESVPLAAATCDVFGLHGSPNGRWIAVDVGCAAGSHTLLLQTVTGQVRPTAAEPWRSSFFLNWAPDGDSFLLRVDPIGDDLILLVDARDGRSVRMDTPPFTYDVAFSPDGGRVLYAVSRGLGFGSEMWLMDWDGRNERVIAPADAGHGYPPAWSPDGRQVAFVARENPGDSAADVAAPYLESNIHLADVASGRARAVTQFEGALTDGPAWSPDGAWLAFSADAGGVADVWLVEVASGAAQQVTQGADARYPVWLADAR